MKRREIVRLRTFNLILVFFKTERLFLIDGLKSFEPDDAKI